jgi:hypothetical protein
MPWSGTPAADHWVQAHSSVILFWKRGSRGNSVSIASGYGLDDRAIGVRSSAEENDCSSSLRVQTISGVHPASCTMGTGVLSLKRGRGVTLTIHPRLVPRSRMSKSCTFSPPWHPHSFSFTLKKELCSFGSAPTRHLLAGSSSRVPEGSTGEQSVHHFSF